MERDHQPEGAGEGRIRLLRCTRCGKAVRRSLVDLLGYTRVGWPKCCEETMSLEILVDSGSGSRASPGRSRAAGS
jgi:hypothetical protein